MRAVALGGGHGTAVTLRALRSLTDEVTGVVSVADDGGSTGRLREMLDVAAVGDIRKCLVALADPANPLAPHMEHRFRAGDLEGHALGNLLLAGIIDDTGELAASVATVGELLGITGVVLPASEAGVTLVARTDEGRTEGQTDIAASDSIRRVLTLPRDVGAPKAAILAIEEADLVVIGPGSLYTSVLAACVVPGITDALAATRARRVFVANLMAQPPETLDYDLGDHLDALARHGVTIDVVVAATESTMAVGDVGEVRVVTAPLCGPNRRVHDADRLAQCLSGLVA